MLGGCLEIEQSVTLNADGSGTQVVHMVVKEQLLEQLVRQQAAAQFENRGNPLAVFDEEQVGSELTAAGMQLERHEVDRTGGLRTVDLTAAFAGFEALQKSPLSGSAAEWELVEGPRPGLLKLTFYPQGQAAWREARARAEQLGDGDDPVLQQFFETRQKQLAGLDVRFTLRLPGKVWLWTRNMERVAEQEVRAVVTAAQIETPQDLVRRLAPRFQVVFDASGTALLEQVTAAGDKDR